MKRTQPTILFNSIPKYVTGVTLVAFFVVVFMGIFDCANPVMRSGMSMSGSHATMADCEPGKNCGMDINIHLQIWQGMITTNLTTAFSTFFASLLLAVFVLRICQVLYSPQTSALIARYLYYNRDHRESKLYNYFIHIFSSGILQPKLFA